MAANEESEWDGGEDRPPEAQTIPDSPAATEQKPPATAATPRQGFYRTTQTPQPAQTHAPVSPAQAALNVNEPAPIEVPATLPADINDCYKLLKSLNGSRNKASRSHIPRVKKHISEIQQGLPSVHIGATEQVRGHAGQSAALQRQRREYLGRENQVAKALLEEFDAQTATIATLTKTSAAQAVEIENLKAELATLKKK